MRVCQAHEHFLLTFLFPCWQPVHMHKPTGRTLTTAEVAELLGITSSAVVKAVSAGRIKPTRKLPGRTGTYMFRRSDVERLAGERGAA